MTCEFYVVAGTIGFFAAIISAMFTLALLLHDEGHWAGIALLVTLTTGTMTVLADHAFKLAGC